MDKRNERIYTTLRPYNIVIRDGLFMDFMDKIFQIDPQKRLNSKALLNHAFLENDYSGK